MTLIESPPITSARVGGDARPQAGSSLLTGRHRIVHVSPVAVELGFELTCGSLHVELAGELCTSTVGLVRRPLLDLVELAGPRLLAVDLSGVWFIDGRGVSMLLTLRSFAEAHGATMRLTATSLRVDRVVALCGLAVVLGGDEPPSP